MESMWKVISPQLRYFFRPITNVEKNLTSYEESQLRSLDSALRSSTLPLSHRDSLWVSQTNTTFIYNKDPDVESIMCVNTTQKVFFVSHAREEEKNLSPFHYRAQLLNLVPLGTFYQVQLQRFYDLFLSPCVVHDEAGPFLSPLQIALKYGF